MADFFFFTEPSKLNDQIETQSFGAIDENNYRLNNLFSSTSNAKAFAVTNGNVMVQPIAGSTSLVNLILKPSNQPDLNLPKIDYIIYKGIIKNSLINTDQVAVSTSNDLTKKVWDSHAKNTTELTDPVPAPLAKDAIGFGYSNSGVGSFLILDEDSLDKVFYDNNNVLPFVDQGNHIGEFDASLFGITIVFEKIGYSPIFKLARELDSKIIHTTLSSSATDAEKFKRKHEKEDSLAFLDSTAFFGSFDALGLNVYDGANFNKKEEEELYSEVTGKHFNKNKVYIDIRNENGDSYNYYNNYEGSLKWDLGDAGTFLEANYYGNGWPIKTILDSEINVTNSDKKIGLSLPIGDNEYPQFFLKKGVVFGQGTEDVESPSNRFLNIIDAEEEYYTLEDKLQLLKSDSGVIKTNYFQIQYIKKYATPDANYKGLALKKESFFDGLFPIFDMKLPYANQGKVDLKVFTEASYIDKTNIVNNEIDYTVNIGIARDDHSINFIAYPKLYNEESVNTRDFFPVYSEQSFTEDTFVDLFKKKTPKAKINAKKFDTIDESYDFLSFAKLLASVVDDGSNDIASLDDEVVAEPSTLGMHYDFDNVDVISFSLDQYGQLESIKNAEFTSPYKVYMGVANTTHLTENQDENSTTFFALRGLKETDAGEIITHEYISDIEVFAENDLYNWDADTETGKVVEAYWVDGSGYGTNKVPYGDDNIRIYIKTEGAIGKEINIRVMHHRTGFDSNYHTISEVVDSDDFTYSFLCTPSFFQRNYDGSSDNIKEFYLSIKIGNGKYRDFSIENGYRLRIHAIRFVPGVCEAKGWEQALNAQLHWFENVGNPDMNNVHPLLNTYDLSWAKGFSRALQEYNDLKNTKWKSAPAIASLQREIEKMITDNIVSIPTSDNSTVFDPFSDQIVFATTDLVPSGQHMPRFEKYYYQFLNHETDTDDDIDDLTATLGSFNWHVAAKGTLTYIDGVTMKVKIEQIRIYIKDNFDFVDGGSFLGAENFLGEWSFISNEVAIDLITPYGYYNIYNEDYRDYRNDIGNGYDHYRYSIPDDIDVGHEFNMPVPS